MKRSWLRRKKWRNPKRSELKRTPINRQSKKRRRLMGQVADKRKEFVASAGVCMACRESNATDCHEIARGPAREKALELPQLQLALCRDCHVAMDSLAEWPHASQLAVRLLWEIEQATLLFNDVRGRARTAVTAKEVIKELLRLNIDVQ